MGVKHKPIPLVDQLEVSIGTFWLWGDNYIVDINWSHCHPELEKYSTPIAEDKFLLDILHTGLDGYTINDDGIKIIEYKLDDQIIEEINQDKEEFEIMRTSMAHRFIKQGHAQPSDYFHMMKMHLIFKKKIKPPKHLKKIIKQEIFQDKADWIADRIDDIVLDLYSKEGELTIKSLFSPKILKSGTGKGRKRKDPKWIPEHIEKATKSIIEKNQTINQAQLHSKKAESTFERDWSVFKYQALRQYLFDLSHNGFIRGDKRVKQTEETSTYTNIHGETLKDQSFNIEITLTEKQLKQMEKVWYLKNLPNPIILSGFASDKKLFQG